MLRNCLAGGCPQRPFRLIVVTGRGWQRMHGDSSVHSAACRPEHPITADCPADCLAPVLPSRILGRLARAEGRHGGEAVASCGPPATVGDVVRLCRQGRLGEIGGLGPLSIREIGNSLVSRGLAAAAGGGDMIMSGCPVDCLRSVMSGRVLNRLARADGRGVPVAPCGPPATVGDVVRLYRQGQLGEIAGLGARSITEIEAGLVFAGLLLDVSPPPRQQPHARRTTTPDPAATTLGGPVRRPGHGPG
jgi:hypothetical protein